MAANRTTQVGSELEPNTSNDFGLSRRLAFGQCPAHCGRCGPKNSLSCCVWNDTGICGCNDRVKILLLMNR
jgi:hypothetical protein